VTEPLVASCILEIKAVLHIVAPPLNLDYGLFDAWRIKCALYL